MRTHSELTSASAADMLVAIAAYCIVLAVLAATAVVAAKGKSGPKKRNISANAQAWLIAPLPCMHASSILWDTSMTHFSIV